jgi:hypothetical protein
MKIQPSSVVFILLISQCSVLGQRKLRKRNAQGSVPQDIPSRHFLPRELEDPSSWPDCIQLTVDDCESLIGRSIKESVKFELINASGGDFFLTMDYDWERVRIYHDDSTPPLVTKPVPKRG